MSEVVERAHAELASGAAWRARDVLAQHLEEELDTPALELLGGVLYTMGDLPAAGAAWFGTDRRGSEVDDAASAWREHFAGHAGNMWRSLPRSVRRTSTATQVADLRERAIERDLSDGREPVLPEKEKTGVDAAVVVAYLILAILLACAAVGLVVILRWMTPG